MQRSYRTHTLKICRKLLIIILYAFVTIMRKGLNLITAAFQYEQPERKAYNLYYVKYALHSPNPKETVKKASASVFKASSYH